METMPVWVYSEDQGAATIFNITATPEDDKETISAAVSSSVDEPDDTFKVLKGDTVDGMTIITTEHKKEGYKDFIILGGKLTFNPTKDKELIAKALSKAYGKTMSKNDIEVIGEAVSEAKPAGFDAKIDAAVKVGQKYYNPYRKEVGTVLSKEDGIAKVSYPSEKGKEIDCIVPTIYKWMNVEEYASKVNEDSSGYKELVDKIKSAAEDSYPEKEGTRYVIGGCESNTPKEGCELFGITLDSLKELKKAGIVTNYVNDDDNFHITIKNSTSEGYSEDYNALSDAQKAAYEQALKEGQSEEMAIETAKKVDEAKDDKKVDTTDFVSVYSNKDKEIVEAMRNHAKYKLGFTGMKIEEREGMWHVITPKTIATKVKNFMEKNKEIYKENLKMNESLDYKTLVKEIDDTFGIGEDQKALHVDDLSQLPSAKGKEAEARKILEKGGWVFETNEAAGEREKGLVIIDTEGFGKTEVVITYNKADKSNIRYISMGVEGDAHVTPEDIEDEDLMAEIKEKTAEALKAGKVKPYEGSTDEGKEEEVSDEEIENIGEAALSPEQIQKLRIKNAELKKDPEKWKAYGKEYDELEAQAGELDPESPEFQKVSRRAAFLYRVMYMENPPWMEESRIMESEEDLESMKVTQDLYIDPDYATKGDFKLTTEKNGNSPYIEKGTEVKLNKINGKLTRANGIALPEIDEKYLELAD